MREQLFGGSGKIYILLVNFIIHQILFTDVQLQIFKRYLSLRQLDYLLQNYKNRNNKQIYIYFILLAIKMQIQQLIVQKKKEKSYGTQSDSSFEEQSNPIGEKKSNLSAKFTSLDKVLSYFKFFTETLPNNDTEQSDNSKYPLTVENIELNKLRINLIEKFLKQLQKNERRSQEIVLVFETQKLVKNCQILTDQQIQGTLQTSKRFKKQQLFTSEILIHEINSSKHTQITTLQIQLLWYKTQIKIFNHLGKAPQRILNNISCSGTFGNVYFLEVQNKQVAIKSIHFQKQIKQKTQKSVNPKISQDNSFLKIQAIKEFFFLLLFSQLQIGPQVRNIGGFDLVIYEDSIEFATEICIAPQTQKQKLKTLKESLFQMHMLQVVHRDIKPSNIMYSPTFNKNVFIDFGGTQVLNEKVGEKTVTQFVGTVSYCSDEVFLLLSQRGIYVDLYFNDVFGLRKSFAQLSEQITHSILQDLETNKNETPQIHEMNRSQYFAFQLINLKYLLHSENYEIFDSQWRYLSTTYNDQNQDWEIKILNFFKELRPNEYLREFYWKQISQKTRDRPQFKELGQIFENQGCQMLFYLSTDIQKKQLYDFHNHFYKILEIDYGTSTPDEKQILKSLVNEKSIKQSIDNLSKKAQSNLIETSDIQNLCLIVSHYCSVSSNLYRISIEQKIRICQQTLNIIEQNDNISFNNLRLTFKCPNQALNTINTFYQYFIQRVLRKIPYKFRSELMVKAVSSLCLLGFPTNNNKMGIEYLLNQLIKQDDQNQYDSQLFLKPNDSDDQIRMEKILLYWECKVVLLFFHGMFYNRDKTKSLMQYNQKELNRMNLATMNLMQPKGNQCNQFFKLNLRFFEMFIVRFYDFNETVSNEICQILRSPALLHLESSSKLISKWKQLMWISEYVFARAYHVKHSTKLRKNVENQIISKLHLDETIFSYLIICCFYQFSQNQITTQQILKKIDSIAGSKKISLRFKLEMRFLNTLQKKDFQQLKQLCSFIRSQIDYSSISQENIEFLKKILIIIYEFFVNYLQQLPNSNNQFKQFMGMCYQMIKLGIEIGMHYFKQKQSQIIFLLFSKAQNNQDQQIIEFIEIVKEINDMKLIKNFAQALISTGQTYKRIIEIILKKSSNQQSKAIENLDQKYSQFLDGLKKNRRVMDYSSLWMSLLSQSKYLRNSIKSDHITSIFIAQLFIEQRKNQQQVMLSHKIIEDLFGEISVSRIRSLSQSQFPTLPTFQIACDYFQVKLLKTNYDLYWCEQLIELYKIYQKQDQLNIILFQDNLIKFIFNSYIYTQKSYAQIEDFLQNLTEIIRKTITTKIILSVKKIFLGLLSCLCKKCFTRQPPPSWNPNKFTEHLLSTLKLEKANQIPYMSLIYYYSMRKKILSFQRSQKFIIFMLKSLKYLFQPVKELLISEIYHFAFSKARPPLNSLLLNEKSLKKQKIKKISKHQMNDKNQRKLIYFYGQFMKNQSEYADLIEDLIEKRLIKEYYVQGYKYPVFIKDLFVKKLRRYHQVRQNYKQVQQITEIANSHNFESRLSLLN